jgi:hypothetical protein
VFGQNHRPWVQCISNYKNGCCLESRRVPRCGVYCNSLRGLRKAIFCSTTPGETGFRVYDSGKGRGFVAGQREGVEVDSLGPDSFIRRGKLIATALASSRSGPVSVRSETYGRYISVPFPPRFRISNLICVSPQIQELVWSLAGQTLRGGGRGGGGFVRESQNSRR